MAELDAAYGSGDPDAIVQAHAHADAYEAALNDYNARVDAHNVRY